MNTDDQTSVANDLLVAGTASLQRDAKPDELSRLMPKSKGGITPLHLTETLKDIRQISSQAAMLLLCSHASRLEGDLQTAKSEKNDVQQKSEDWMKAYYDEARKTAVLKSELQSVSSKKNLQKFVGTVGGLIAGVAIPFLFVESTRGWGLAGTIVGVALLIAGFWPTHSKLSDT